MEKTVTAKDFSVKFIRFLKKNDALENFIQAFNTSDAFNFRLRNEYVVLPSNTLYVSYIENAFSWSRSEQGHEYWEKLNSQWHDSVSKLVYVCGYKLVKRGKREGFNIGCQHFTFADLNTAITLFKTRKKTAPISGERKIEKVGSGKTKYVQLVDSFECRVYDIDINKILSMYHLKQLK